MRTRPLCLAAILVASLSIAQEQVNDPEFSTRVANPAFLRTHPRVGIDEGHRNFHTRDGRYLPFAKLIEADGLSVAAAPPFDGSSLSKIDILVIANAMGESADGKSMQSAFTEQECDAIEKWVRDGGSLLLIADHAPWGDAALRLAQRFGVAMGRGFAMDAKNSDGNPTKLVFSHENGLLGNHAILSGRNPSEQIRKVVAFTGQSLTIPPGASVLLRLSDEATESFDTQDQVRIQMGQPAGTKIPRRAQGIALTFGSGRVAVFGEAAMFSAQVATINGQSFKAGMNVPGNDDRQLALNVMHWLARLIN